MYFSKRYTKSSLSTIGTYIGGKDHATVLHACKTVNNLKDTDKHFREQVERIADEISIVLGKEVKYYVRTKSEFIEKYEGLILEKERLQKQIPSKYAQVQISLIE
jgi:hypothetical protein